MPIDYSENVRVLVDELKNRVPVEAGAGLTMPKTTIEVRAPYDGQLIDTVETVGADAVEAALETAYRLFRDRDAWLSPATRVRVLRETARRMAEQAEELAVEAAQRGRQAAGRLAGRGGARDRRGAEQLPSFCARRRATSCRCGSTRPRRNRIAFTRHEPIGVVVALSAFNHPLNLIVHQAARAIAAGCPVIVKPAARHAALLLPLRLASA